MSVTEPGTPLISWEGIDVFVVDDQGGPAWDDALCALGGGAPFATSAWRPVLMDYFGVVPVNLLACAQGHAGDWVGCLAAYINRDWTGQRYFYGVRQGMYATPAAAEALVAAAQQQARMHDCVGIDLSSTDPVLDRHDGYRERTTFRLALTRDSDAMWRQLRDKSRNMVRRAQKAGVSVRELAHGSEGFETLADHNARNLLPKGVPVPGPDYFAAVCGAHGAHAHILSAWLDETVIASMLVLRHGDLAAYPVQNADPEYRRLAPIQLLTWEAMCLAATKGCNALDMGESGIDSPVYKAKRNFGGVPTPVYSLIAPAQSEVKPARVAGTRIRSLLDGVILRHSPMILRQGYGRWRYRRGRIL